MESHKIYCNCIAEQSSNPPADCASAYGAQFRVSGSLSLCSRHEQPSMVLWVGAEQSYATAWPGVSWDSEQSAAQCRLCLRSVWGENTATHGECFLFSVTLVPSVCDIFSNLLFPSSSCSPSRILPFWCLLNFLWNYLFTPEICPYHLILLFIFVPTYLSLSSF